MTEKNFKDDGREEKGFMEERETEMGHQKAEKEYQEVEIFEIPALFDNARIPTGNVPEGFTGHSLSVSNVVVTKHGGKVRAYKSSGQMDGSRARG